MYCSAGGALLIANQLLRLWDFRFSRWFLSISFIYPIFCLKILAGFHGFQLYAAPLFSRTNSRKSLQFPVSKFVLGKISRSSSFIPIKNVVSSSQTGYIFLYFPILYTRPPLTTATSFSSK